LAEGGRAGPKDDPTMKYVVKLQKTIILTEYVEVSDAISVVDAMNKAEEASKNFFPEDEQSLPRKESKWAVTSVRTEDEQ
jgi:hypothetical protein